MLRGNTMLTLYHAGYEIIDHPDVKYGRKNADFGQGFYMTDNYDFACIWVKEKPGADVIINKYELDEGSLKKLSFERNSKWFEYIFSNRRSQPDIYAEYDVIIGPIANDTIYDTLGIMTSNILNDEEAMKLMMVGETSDQIVLKTQKAADNLRFVSSQVLSKEIIVRAKEQYEADNEKYQEEFARAMEELDRDSRDAEEVLTINVRITETYEVKGSHGTARMILFDGDADSEYFKGTILPGGVDTQKDISDKDSAKTFLSARYILKGTDRDGNDCSIFIENNGEFSDTSDGTTTPTILTDSPALSFLECASLYGTIEGIEGGVRIHIYIREKV